MEKKCYSSLFPPLTAEQYAQLRQSIQENGVEVAVIEDAEGNVIDGLHRKQICAELKLRCPTEVREFASESEKFELALRLNCVRRQLNRLQKEMLIEAYLLADSMIAPATLAEVIGGISKNTVAQVRQRMEATRQIDELPKLRGKDGRLRPQKYRRIITNSPNELESAQKAIHDLPPSCGGKILDTRSAVRSARRHAKKEELARQIILPSPDEDIRLYHCPFQELDIAPASVNLICTDFPYGRDFLAQLPELAAFAQRVLVDGGLFVSFSGTFYLDQVLRSFGDFLQYRWMAASVWDGDGTLVHPLDLTSKWKPVVIFSKGEWKKRGRWQDLLYTNAKEKEWHPWQQPIQDVETLVRYFSQPGDLVVDPCGGGFTTALACRNLGRRCVSCDIDEACVQRGQERLSQNMMTPESVVAKSHVLEVQAEADKNILLSP